MSGLEDTLIDCPYCGESLSILVDTSAGNQQYVEDCQVCCSPILLNIEITHEGHIQVIASQENG